MRARNIKPGFFKNEELAQLPYAARILFAGLWCLADRDGYLEDRPARIKAEALPYDNEDADHLLNLLGKSEFIIRYSVDGKRYIYIPSFLEHQNPHLNEKASTCPKYVKSLINIEKLPDKNGSAPEKHETTPADSLIPDSLIPDSGITPLSPPNGGRDNPPANLFGSDVGHAAPSAQKRSSRRKRQAVMTPWQADKFEQIYKGYWRKESKQSAQKAFAEIVTSESLVTTVSEAIKAQYPGMMRRLQENRPLFATWLRAERWLDEVQEPINSRGPKSTHLDELERRFMEGG